MDEDIAGDMLRPIADAATIKQYGELAEGVQTLSIQPTGGLGRDPELPATMASDDHSGQQHTRIAEMAVNNLLQHRASNEENPASSTIKSFPAVINNALVFIEGADLRLEVGKKKTPCMVSSKALACASEIFMEMLYGEHSASHVKHIAGEWVVQFPEDDINAISILLSIIHGSPETVPMKLPIQNAALIDATSSETFRDGYADAGLAYLVALAADKYGLTHLLKPWAHSWLDEFRKADRWSSKHCGEILGAAWLLGDEDLLSAQLDRFVSSTWQEMDEQGQLNDGFLVYDTFQETHAWSTSSAAHHILNTMGIWELMRSTSLKLIELYLYHFHAFYDDPLAYMDPGCISHMGPDSPDRSLVLQSLEAHLEEFEFSPLSLLEAEDWLYDINQLEFCINNFAPIMMLPAEQLFTSFHCRHCTPFKGLLTALREARGTGHLISLTEAHKAHLSQKRKESGIDEPRQVRT